MPPFLQVEELKDIDRVANREWNCKNALKLLSSDAVFTYICLVSASRCEMISTWVRNGCKLVASWLRQGCAIENACDEEGREREVAQRREERFIYPQGLR